MSHADVHRPPTRLRRCTWRCMSIQTLVAIRMSHQRTADLPSKLIRAAFQARTIVSWTASSASNPEPSIR